MLESNVAPGRARQLLGSLWATWSGRQLARPLAIPKGTRVIGVGGATLGGSHKTPLAIALTKALAAKDTRVALVGHAYRARPERARVVTGQDRVSGVGDDALSAARALASSPLACVVVGPSRQAAVDFGARQAEWLVVDGLLQSRPDRLSRSMLALDAEVLLGNGHCPPAGDLRAPVEALLREADAILLVCDTSAPLAALVAGSKPTFEIGVVLDSVIDARGLATPLASFARASFGLVLSVARPERIERALLCRGLVASVTLRFADHARPSLAALEHATRRSPVPLEAWLTTAKCATKLPDTVAGIPVLTLRHELVLPDHLLSWMTSRDPSSPPGKPW